MSDPREPRVPGFEEALPLGDVLVFQNEIVIPSIDFLARKEFVKDALPRSSFMHEETIVTEDSIKKVQAKAFVTEERVPDSDSGETQRVSSISVAVEVPRPDLTDVLVEKYNALKHKNGSEDGEDENDDQGLLSAWEVTVYYFQIPDDPDEVPEARTHIELQDIEENVLWDDDDEAHEQFDCEHEEYSEQHYEDLGELAKSFPIGMKKSDLEAIQLALLDLGVDFDIVFPGLDQSIDSGS